jgi:hypothetical protein
MRYHLTEAYPEGRHAALRPVSALPSSVTKVHSEDLENRPITHPGNHVLGRRQPTAFRDRPAFALFFVRLLRDGPLAVRGRVPTPAGPTVRSAWPDAGHPQRHQLGAARSPDSSLGGEIPSCRTQTDKKQRSAEGRPGRSGRGNPRGPSRQAGSSGWAGSGRRSDSADRPASQSHGAGQGAISKRSRCTSRNIRNISNGPVDRA